MGSRLATIAFCADPEQNGVGMMLRAFFAATIVFWPVAAMAQSCALMPQLADTPLCQTLDSLPQSTPPEPTRSLNVTLSITSDGSATPTIYGHTNLPDGTELEVSLAEADGAMAVSSDAVVAKGGFQAGPFSDRGRELNSGAYSVEITSGDAELQPEAIQAVIGTDGGNMRGSAVVPDPFQPGHRVIDTTFQIAVAVP
jgi:hypothetical protein